MKKFYVAGPMTGIPQFNFPAFFAAEKSLQEQGYEVQLPADMKDPVAVAQAMASVDGKIGDVEVTWGQCLAQDVELIADHVDGLCFLPNWEKSRGARLEAFTALLCNRQFAHLWPDDGVVYPLHADDVRLILMNNMP